ncbi:MAG: MTAP family purine nucleoside phosphorylase [Gemmatimonadota bacterium]|jgi:5'-methylthioadenosine phosphorylase
MMERLGIIGGSAFLGDATPADTEVRPIDTERGEVHLHVGPTFVFLRRHGHEGYRPPHRIPHHAHALALHALGVRRVVGLCSVGALHAELRPGTVVVPEDYLSFHAPPTFAGDERLHIVPRLDTGLRRVLVQVARTTKGPVHDGGVYGETPGPRFETRAEIRLLADYADIVGMTAASEATLLQEKGIRYGILGIVDNFAHGIDVRPLTLEAFDRQVEANGVRARGILDALIEWSRTVAAGETNG